MPSSNRDSRADEVVGDLAIVLHSHMPYVEGFGTYPFGEEWLFDAVARSYLPLLDQVRDLTVTVTPVLADQLEAPGVAERMQAFLRRYRLEAAERDAASSPELRLAAEGEAERYRRSLARLDDFEGDVLAAFRLAGERRSAGAVLPLTRSCRWSPPPPAAPSDRRRTALAERRFGPAEGSGSRVRLPPGIERLAERGLRYFCRPERQRASSTRWPGSRRCGLSPSRWTGRRWSCLGAGRLSLRPRLRRFPPGLDGGTRLWATGGDRYDPGGGAGAERTPVVRRRRGRAAWAFRDRATAPASSPSRSTPSCSAIGGRRARTGWRRSCAWFRSAGSAW
jgi:hypothetical protein